MKTLVAILLCTVCLAQPIQGQVTQPIVAVHDSELTRALESMPATSPTPTGTGTTGYQWWPSDWHYFVMPESVKEALRSDGTAFAVIGDADISAGALLANGLPKYPILVAQEDKDIVGWASMSAWSDRCAYSVTAEASLYVREGQQGKGLGRKLSEAILKAGKEAGLHTAIIRIAEGNDISSRLAKSLGFKPIGVMQEVGKKFGKLLDVTLMQILFD